MPPEDAPPPDELWDGLAAAARGDAGKLAALARVAMGQGRLDTAYALARDARIAAPDDPAVRALTAEPLAHGVPAWHVPMVQETARNLAYAEAIERAVKPGMRVLDIGAGTGLLAMIAARAGAGQVFTCEQNPAIADAAEDIIARNGHAGRVRVLRKHSTDIDPEGDLGGPVDLLVSEILASDLLMEGVLRTIADAARRLLKPGGIIIPGAGEVRVALACWGGLPGKLIGEALGFDLSAFNRLVAVPHRLSIGDRMLAVTSAPVSLFAFDFTRSDIYRGGKAQHELEATGPANGIVQWIRVQLDPAVVYENAPCHGASSAWFAAFYPLDRPVETGQTVTVSGKYTRDAVLLWSETFGEDAADA
ncbi:MAG TPA: 50S ribosomal protein L11 methyltransferase [Sphingopyxis sp.]|nr:50S ribosomal protein L11 methyltransferase [Sphingopyxis sp.]HMQ18739.1 50S ribosomal protein L11 methyltransferase [Sphingopyxis sp.]